MAIVKSKKDQKELSSAMQRLLEDQKNLTKLPQIGELVTGNVISASKKEVLIDVEGITTGIVRGKELYNESEEFSGLQEDDEVEATVLELENEQGMVELSFRYAGHQKAWTSVNELKTKSAIVKAKILDANKGGLIVTLNHLQGFLPVSQLNPEHYPRIQGGDKNKILEKLKGYVGQSFDVKVLDADGDQEKLIVSEKAAWEETQSDVLQKYKVNDIIEGTVTAITDFGVFVKFGENLEGLAHISELAWQRIDDPRKLFKVDQPIKAAIINIEGSKIFLSLKKLQDDPWSRISDKYVVGQEIEGKILKVNPFGLFVELDAEIHGLAHISELSDKPITNIHEFATSGETKIFKIVSIEPDNHRLGLSLKAVGKTVVVADEKPKKKKEEKAEEEPAKEEEKEEAPKAEETKEEKTEASEEEKKEA